MKNQFLILMGVLCLILSPAAFAQDSDFEEDSESTESPPPE